MRRRTSGSAAWRSCARSERGGDSTGLGGKTTAVIGSLGWRGEAWGGAAGRRWRREWRCWWRHGRRRRRHRKPRRTRSIQVKPANRSEGVELAPRLEAARRAEGPTRAVHSGVSSSMASCNEARMPPNASCSPTLVPASSGAPGPTPTLVRHAGARAQPVFPAQYFSRFLPLPKSVATRNGHSRVYGIYLQRSTHNWQTEAETPSGRYP